jgi:hypothetical protein
MKISTFLPRLKKLPACRDQIVHIERIAPREAWHELTGEQKSLLALASEYGVSYESVRCKREAAKLAEVV